MNTRHEFRDLLAHLVDESKPALINAISLIGIQNQVLANGIGVDEVTVLNWVTQKEEIPLKMCFVIITFLEQCLQHLEQSVLFDKSLELSSRFLSGKIFALARYHLFDTDNDLLKHSPEEIRDALLQADKYLQTLVNKNKPKANTYPVRRWMN
jgi:hypothetical protein